MMVSPTQPLHPRQVSILSSLALLLQLFHQPAQRLLFQVPKHLPIIQSLPSPPRRPTIRFRRDSSRPALIMCHPRDPSHLSLIRFLRDFSRAEFRPQYLLHPAMAQLRIQDPAHLPQIRIPWNPHRLASIIRFLQDQPRLALIRSPRNSSCQAAQPRVLLRDPSFPVLIRKPWNPSHLA